LADEITNYTEVDVSTKFGDINLPQNIVDTVGGERFSFALAARINVMGMLKQLLGLPPSHMLKTKENVLASVLNFDVTNDLNFTALDIAAYNGHKDIVEALLTKKATKSHLQDSELDADGPPSAADGNLRSALKCAAYGGHEDVIRLLLKSTKDNQLRLHGAGLVALNNAKDGTEIDDTAEVAEREENHGTLKANLAKLKPVIVTFKDLCSVRSLFFCPPGKRAYFEVEVVRAGEGSYIGFASDSWSAAKLGGTYHPSSGIEGRGWKNGDVIGVACDLASDQVIKPLRPCQRPGNKP
jgi:hypothetical protein